MKNLRSKRSLLVPVGFFTVFIITGSFKLFRAVTAHNTLLIVMSAVGIALSIIGLLLIVPYLRREVKTV
jgi:cytochrome c biogenesis protein CcdA